eukprot:SAG22_NODE_14305_length_378_cov_0.913978_1_plen_94_part_01
MGYPRVRIERALEMAGGDVGAAKAFMDSNASKPDEFWVMDEYSWRQFQRGQASAADLASEPMFERSSSTFSDQSVGSGVGQSPARGGGGGGGRG